jgi:hypothetical protein
MNVILKLSSFLLVFASACKLCGFEQIAGFYTLLILWCSFKIASLMGALFLRSTVAEDGSYRGMVAERPTWEQSEGSPLPLGVRGLREGKRSTLRFLRTRGVFACCFFCNRLVNLSCLRFDFCITNRVE